MVMFLPLFVGIFTIVLSNPCKDVKPMENISLSKHAGVWYHVGMNIQNPSDAERYSELKCGRMNISAYNGEDAINNIEYTYISEGKPSVFNANYTAPDPTKGRLRTYVDRRKMYFDLTIACTDYTTYTINYACAEITPDEVSEFTNLMIRDTKKYDEVLANPDVTKCFGNISPKPIKDLLKKLPFDNCPHSA